MEEKTNFLEKFWYIFVIVALILIGVVVGLWFNNQKISSTSTVQKTVTPTVELPSPQPAVNEDAQTVALENQSESDEVEAIETDLQATDFSNLDQEMASIEAEISNPE